MDIGSEIPSIMKAFHLDRKSNLIIFNILLIGMFLSLQSCLAGILSMNSNLIVEHDEVKKLTRYKKTLNYDYTEEWKSSFITNEQLIVKETDEFNEKYDFYEYLKFENRFNQIENTIYIIVDSKNYPIMLKSQFNESITEIEKVEEDVILADSSKISVITDYEIRDYSYINIQYQLDDELINEIANAEDVKIRYYAPPEMITLKLSNLKLRAFQALAEAKYEDERYAQ